MAVTHAALERESNMGEYPLCPLIRLISEVEPTATGILLLLFSKQYEKGRRRKNKALSIALIVFSSSICIFARWNILSVFPRQHHIALTLSNAYSFTLALVCFRLGARACNTSASNPVLILIPAWDGGLEVFVPILE